MRIREALFVAAPARARAHAYDVRTGSGGAAGGARDHRARSRR